MPPVIVFHTKYARRDWWLFAVFVVAAALACTALGFAMERDEVRASRTRAEYVARTLAERFAIAGATPGSDFSATLVPLAAAGAPDLKLAVVEEEGGQPFNYVVRGRYIDHSDPTRGGHALDARDPEDRRTIDLVALAQQGDAKHAILIWSRGEVGAAAVSPNRQVTAIVDGLRPGPLSKRPRTIALVAFLMLVVFSAGLHDILPRIGRYLNVAVLAGGVIVLALLGAALEPSLWRGVTDDLLVRRAELLRLADLTRALVQDLPPPASDVSSWGAPAAAAACGIYVVALSGAFRRATSSLGRGIRVHRLAAPAFGVLAFCSVAPILATVVLSLVQATPTQRAFVGIARFADLLSVSPANPTSMWRVLGVNVAWVAANASLQVGLGLLLTVVGSLLNGRLLSLFRRALLLPWAIPTYAAALAGGQVLRMPAFLRLAPAGVGSVFVSSVIVNVWIGAPLLAALGLLALDRLPSDAVEALRLEGVGPWGPLRYLTLPFLRPQLSRALAFAALLSVNAFPVLDVLSGAGSGGATDLLVLRAYRWAFQRYDFGVAAAWTVIAIVTTFGLAALAHALLRGRQPDVAVLSNTVAHRLALEAS